MSTEPNKSLVFPDEISYPDDTLLTDGTNLIYLRVAIPPDWTPQNNYGSKRTEYYGSTYPIDQEVNGIRTIMHYTGRMHDRIPGLWFQKDGHLNGFIPIAKELINTEILKQLLP